MTNNISSLPIYYSKENLTTRFFDYSNVYVLPSICIFGLATSLTSILVAVKRDDREPSTKANSNKKSFDYILLNSIIDFLFLLIELFVVVVRCGVLCPYGNKYGSKFYEIYIYLYVGYVLATSQLLLSIYIAYDRLSMFSAAASNKKQMSIFRVYSVCLLVSLLANLSPYLLSREVIPLGILRVPVPGLNSTFYDDILYVKSFRSAFQTTTANFLLTANLVVKDIFMFVLLTILNSWLCVKFRSYMRSRKTLLQKSTTTSNFVDPSVFSGDNDKQRSRSQLQSAEKRESKFTLLTLISCLNYIVGNFIDTFAIMANIFEIDIYMKYWFISVFGNVLFFFSHGVHFFVYYFFNGVFKRLFNRLIRIRR